MTLPELAAQTLQPQAEQMADYTAYIPERHTAPQSWYASVADARIHWYDLIAGFPERLDIHDPVGRYQRRMQFELDAVASRHHLFFALTCPPVRFDAAGTVHWGFFSLKLTLPLLVGQEQKRDSITFELTVPFAATLKKPLVQLTAKYVTLNWGGLVETFSVHDILLAHAPDKVPCVAALRQQRQQVVECFGHRQQVVERLRRILGRQYQSQFFQRGLLIVLAGDLVG